MGRAGTFQSTPSGGKATKKNRCGILFLCVSIHAFRGEGDSDASTQLDDPVFQSTPSGGKATTEAEMIARKYYRFQSTPSGGKATASRFRWGATKAVSIHAFRGEGDCRARLSQHRVEMFQSTPSGGKATKRRSHALPDTEFQSTPSGGKATRPPALRRRLGGVSIHAFRGEGDGHWTLKLAAQRCFNPRLPGGRRLAFVVVLWYTINIVSIHAFRGEGDGCLLSGIECSAVSIHAFRGEGDDECVFVAADDAAFQSTPSGGKATQCIE